MNLRNLLRPFLSCPSACAPLAIGLALVLGTPAHAQSPEPVRTQPMQDLGLAPDDWNLHGQFTTVFQYHPGFGAAYSGGNSLYPSANARETADLTLYAGMRLWDGAALYLNPELDQGYGLGTTLGIAAFPSGEAYKLGARNPYFRLPRAFVRQVFMQGGDEQQLEDAPNQLAEKRSGDNLILTVGKFSVVDVFDTNRYAHDPRGDFLNWALIDAGAFDYAADAWGFSYGSSVEWTQSWWTLRGGLFALSKVPNTRDLEGRFAQFEWVAEAEARYTLGGQAGKVKLLAFDNRGRMGKYDTALDLAARTGTNPDTAAVRRFASRAGAVLNLEQAFSEQLGGFVRLSANDGSKEAFEFTEINQSASAGLALSGAGWSRAGDTVGAAIVMDRISAAAQRYFSAGGMGILIGDGALHAGMEKVLETYYAAQLARQVVLTADLQEVVNPAYNRDRGPITVLGLRLHAEF
jgi:high affinity Mn2+ porin